MNTRKELLRAFDETDRRARELVTGLDRSLLEVPYDPGINPPVWELGHTAFFTEFFLLRAVADPAPRMPGHDEVWDSFEIPHDYRWRPGVVPDLATTLDYDRRIRDEARARIESGPLDPGEHYLARYAVCHRNMHVESMIWCRQTLGYPPPASARYTPAGTAPEAEPGDVLVPGGRYRIGLSADAPFGFDNERPGHEAVLAPFAVSRTPVTNGEFLDFVESGGYADPAAWSLPGRCWLERTGAAHPRYWRRDGDGAWRVRRFDAWHDLDPAAPVLHVSWWEADAFCRFAGRRLPTEAEWEAAARGPDGRRFPWGDEMEPARVDTDAVAFATAPAASRPEGASPAGCLQMLGTAWEWTADPFLPYPGFAPDMYRFMSTLQFGDHRTARGGSCATSSCLLRATYRQPYHPDRRDVFTGFRTCALSSPG